MHYQTKSATTIFWILVTGCLVVAGCAGTANLTSEAMVPGTVKVDNHFMATVSVKAQGGREKHPLGKSSLSNDNLVDAVKKAIVKNRLFSSILENNEDYRLNLFIVKVSHPIVATDFTVTVEIGWTLSRSQNKKIIWQKSIITRDRVTTEESAIYDERLIIAIQRSTKANIQEGLSAISDLTL